MKALVLYHGNCPDGFTAAWVIWKSIGASAEYRAVNYGEEPPIKEASGKRLILVDFSYPKQMLTALFIAANSIEVYDHHKTAQADLVDWPYGKVVFDMNRSGAGIAWDEFRPRVPCGRSLLVDYVEDRDLWRWKLPHSREISEYLFSLPRTFEEWDKVNDLLGTTKEPPHDIGFHWVVDQGITLLRAKRIRVETVCKNVRWMIFNPGHGLGGLRIPVVNTAWDFSEIGEYLCAKFPDAPAGGYYFDRGDKRQWGFRSPGEFDVSDLCRMYGGGGHKAAAGFTSEIGWEPRSWV